jgi:hypothetical protein
MKELIDLLENCSVVGLICAILIAAIVIRWVWDILTGKD